ncbi:MAG: hypothetical protein ACLQGN_14155 [Mycobacterium sp.]|jgi:hypothetical protein
MKSSVSHQLFERVAAICSVKPAPAVSFITGQVSVRGGLPMAG